MKAYEKTFLRFLEGTDKHFVIPVYQRNYDWKKEQCEQLFNDIVDICKNNYRTHFIGSIVSVYNEDDLGQEYLIIDGQQRITTISIILIAIYNLLSDEQLSSDQIIREKVRDEYLINKYSLNQYKIKLKSVKEDQKYFSSLINNDYSTDDKSNIIINYNFFVEKLKNIKLAGINLDDFYKAINKLMIVEIELKRGDDDPQLIFESLNSTGLNLTQADLVRNFVLMKETKEKQIFFFNKYWTKIECNTGFHVSEFIRDYLSYKENIIPNKDKVYFSFKKYVFKNHLNEDIEVLLGDLLKFSDYYRIIISSDDQDIDISRALKYINEIDITVCYPFLLDIYNDYSENILSKDNLLNILNIVRSFAFRRIICDVPTNALNKIFVTLGKEIKKHKDFLNKYVEIFKYVLLSKKGSQRFPGNDEFIEKIINRDIYNLKGKNKIHLLESIENYNNRERINLEELLKNGDINIEHIMPQVLTKGWKESLGQDYDVIHEKYLHTLGNITLTAYNSKMSNKSFIEKRDMPNGYRDSKLLLNQSLKNIELWNKKSILKRADLLKDVAIKVWNNIHTNYLPKNGNTNTYSLSDDHDFTNEKINSFIIFDETYMVKSWRKFYEKLCALLYELDPIIFESFINDEDFKGKIRTYVSYNPEELRRPIKINNIYLEANLSAESILYQVRLILKKYDLSEDDLLIIVEK
jgi:uncharacterized protein with ParB-like and HNH nuclease domain